MTVLLNSRVNIHGIGPKLLRIAARNLYKLDSAEIHDLCVVIGAKREHLFDLWHYLLNGKYIELCQDGRHRPTALMHDLSMARIGSPISVEKAKSLIDRVIEKAESENNSIDSEAMFYVKRLAVFGSYFHGKKAELGDVDMAWELIGKSRFKNRISNMRCMGLSTSAQMRGLLLPKNSGVRMMEIREIEDLRFEFKVIYEFPEEKLLKNEIEYRKLSGK